VVSKRHSNVAFTNVPRRKPRVCKICRSTSRWLIEEKLLTAVDLKKTIKALTADHPLTKTEVEEHLPHIAKEMVEPSSPEYGDMIIKSVDDMLRQAQEIVNEARSENLYRTALDGLKIMGALLTTQAKLLGHLKPDQKNSVNLHVSLPANEVAKLAEDYAATVVEVGHGEGIRDRTPASDD